MSRAPAFLAFLAVVAVVAACATPPAAGEPPRFAEVPSASASPAKDRTLDTDCDGIADVDDACPREAEDRDGFEDEDGCPDRDDDRDGVPDVCDRCPREPGEDGQGCPRPKQVVIADQHIRIIELVAFGFGSAKPLPRSIVIIDAAAQVLVENPRIKKIAVTGHASQDEPRRDALSKSRADAVVKLLVAKGVAQDRLEARAAGSSLPIASGATVEGRERNRRVEFQVLDFEPAETPPPLRPRRIDADPPCLPAVQKAPEVPCHVPSRR